MNTNTDGEVSHQNGQINYGKDTKASENNQKFNFKLQTNNTEEKVMKISISPNISHTLSDVSSQTTPLNFLIPSTKNLGFYPEIYQYWYQAYMVIILKDILI